MSDAANDLRQSPMVRELVEDATKVLSAEVARLHTENARLHTENARQRVYRQRTECARDAAVAWCNEVRKADFWTRLKWVFTGVVL